MNYLRNRAGSKDAHPQSLPWRCHCVLLTNTTGSFSLYRRGNAVFEGRPDDNGDVFKEVPTRYEAHMYPSVFSMSSVVEESDVTGQRIVIRTPPAV